MPTKRILSFAFQDSPSTPNVYRTDVEGYDVELSAILVAAVEIKNRPTEFFSDLAERAGAFLVKDLERGFDVSESIPCPEGRNVSPRRLRVVFPSGSKMSVPINASNIGDVSQTARAVWDYLKDPANGGALCADLIGEQIDSLNDVLGVNFDATVTTASSGGNNFYAGKINYTTDLGSPSPGRKAVVSVKVMSETRQIPPIFANSWETCVQEFVSTRLSCGTGDNIKHRRFVVDYITPAVGGGDPIPEQRELPINPADIGAKRGNIKSCGELIASNRSVFCIGYRGESWNRIHRAL